MTLQLDAQEVFDAQGQVMQAYSAYCACDDDSDIFFLYWPVNLDHPHAKCAQCEEAHCIYNICPMPPMPPPDHEPQ